MCRFIPSCTKYHLGIFFPVIHSVESNDSVSGQWRPWSDSTNTPVILRRCTLILAFTVPICPKPFPIVRPMWQWRSRKEPRWTVKTMIWDQGPVVQSIISLMSSLRVISLTVWADSIYNNLIFFAEKMWVAFSYSHFFSKKFQHICVSLHVNFNESLTNDIVSFEQLGPD